MGRGLVARPDSLARSVTTWLAGVAKRQTQRTQNPPSLRTCGFKSRPRHQQITQGVVRFFPPGNERCRGIKLGHAPQIVAVLCRRQAKSLARRVAKRVQAVANRKPLPKGAENWPKVKRGDYGPVFCRHNWLHAYVSFDDLIGHHSDQNKIH